MVQFLITPSPSLLGDLGGSGRGSRIWGPDSWGSGGLESGGSGAQGWVVPSPTGQTDRQLIQVIGPLS